MPRVRAGGPPPPGFWTARVRKPKSKESAIATIKEDQPMTEIVIAAAARTPVGAFNGGLSSVPAHYLGQVAIAEAIKRAGVAAGEVSEVIMGQILSAGEGQNPARQAAIAAGIPVE